MRKVFDMEERTNGFGTAKRKRGMFNLVDLMFVLAVVLIVVIVFFLLDPFSLNTFGETEKQVVLEYTVQIDYVEASLTDNIRLGDLVTYAANKATFGRVSAVKNDILYSEAYYNAEADVVSMKEYPDKYNLQITVTTDAVFEKGVGYTVKGTRMAVGGEYSLMFPNFVGSGYCIGMREVG